MGEAGQGAGGRVQVFPEIASFRMGMRGAVGRRRRQRGGRF